MDYINLNPDIKLSRFCFGCEQLGMHNWGNLREDDLEKSIKKAIDLGVNFFDTSDIYGLGKSESNLSKFLGNDLNNVFIATKFGIRFNNNLRYFDNSEDWINEALNSSLKRLKRNYIDFYLLHYWDQKTSLDDILNTLIKLKTDGKIRKFGFSNLAIKQLGSKFAKESQIFSYEYSLVNTENEGIIDSMINNAIFMAYGVLGQGILTGKYTKHSIFEKNDRRSNERYSNFYGEKLLKNLNIVEKLTNISNKYEVPISQIALKWVVEKYKKCIIIVGIKNEEQLMKNISIFDWKLLNTDFDTIHKQIK